MTLLIKQFSPFLLLSQYKATKTGPIPASFKGRQQDKTFGTERNRALLELNLPVISLQLFLRVFCSVNIFPILFNFINFYMVS